MIKPISPLFLAFFAVIHASCNKLVPANPTPESTPTVTHPSSTATFTPLPTIKPTLPVINTTLGQLTPCQDRYGIYYSYLPTTLTDQSEILVLVHGTPIDGSAEENAQLYATTWMDFAEENGLVLIAPAFTQKNFSSRYGDQAMGGYRGLFGREIDADDWVINLVDRHRQVLGLDHEQFYLYGHSAGGQFTARFLVMHPERIKRAVITSAATYPQPTLDVQWPFGMGELHTEIIWDAESTNLVDVVPDQKVWLSATQVPLSVIVGLNDTSEIQQEFLVGQKGKNRSAIARNWVADMQAFAASNGLESQFKLDLIPGVGHSMIGLIPYSQKAILPQIPIRGE